MEETAATPLDQLRADYEAHPEAGHTAARLAEHYADLGWYNEALDVYREALSKNPGEMSLLVGYGNTCLRHSDFHESLDAFKKLTEVKPERIEGWNNLGIVFMSMGNTGAAQTAFDRVLQLEPDNAGALLNMGNCMTRKGDAAGARVYFKQATEAKPDYADGWFNLGNSYLAEKDFPQAAFAFEKALKYQREFPSALKNLGYVHEQQYEWEKAAGCYRRAAALDRVDAGIQINLANACMALELFEEAKNSFLKSVKLAPRNTAGWMGLRHIALMKGDLPTYMRATRAILPHLSEAAIAKTIEILLCLDHPDEAKEIVAGAERCKKQSDELDAQRMLVFRRCSIEEHRQQDLYNRLSLLPLPERTDPVCKALARYAFECADFAAAKRHALAVQHTDAKTQSIVIRSSIALGDKKEAQALIKRNLAEQPDDGEMHFLMARLSLEEGCRDSAAEELLLALETGYTDIVEIGSVPALQEIFEAMGAKG